MIGRQRQMLGNYAVCVPTRQRCGCLARPSVRVRPCFTGHPPYPGSIHKLQVQSSCRPNNSCQVGGCFVSGISIPNHETTLINNLLGDVIHPPSRSLPPLQQQIQQRIDAEMHSTQSSSLAQTTARASFFVFFFPS